MVQEYLFLSDEIIEEIKQFHVDDVKMTLRQLKGSSCWIVSISKKGNNLTTAKVLSDANDFIVSTYNPVVITNGCAAYFTQRLYPLAVDFERGLRQLLYLKSAISKSTESAMHIVDLEHKNLDDIRKLLYYDMNFIESVRRAVNLKGITFEKAEIIKKIETIEEKTVSDLLFSDNPPKHLKDRFSTLMDYRNDIMHSHNINYNRYIEISNLFEQVNEEIKLATDDLLAKEFDSKNAMAFDESLGEAIQAQNEVLNMAIYEQSYYALLESYLNNPAIEAARQIATKIDSSSLAEYEAQTRKMMAKMDLSKLPKIEEQALKIIARINSSEFQKTIDQAAKFMAYLKDYKAFGRNDDKNELDNDNKRSKELHSQTKSVKKEDLDSEKKEKPEEPNKE